MDLVGGWRGRGGGRERGGWRERESSYRCIPLSKENYISESR